MDIQAFAAGGAAHLRKRDDMFGKARDIHDSDILDTSALDEFFGDESAAENTVEIHELRDRVRQAELQITSQFTSLATYAQIAQEQVELARSEAKAATERSEQRLTSLIERERADRISSSTGVAAENSSDISSRLDALEQSVTSIREGLDDSRQQQKDLARAITAMFDWLTESNVLGAKRDAAKRTGFPAPSATEPPAFPAPSGATAPSEPAFAADAGLDGPISGLSLNN